MADQGMPLDWLDFDFSEDEDGNGSFDAMAAATPAQWAALEAEVLRVLDWAEDTFPDARAPLDEGGTWDVELQAVEEVATPLQVDADLAAGRLRLARGTAGAPRITLSLTLSGNPAFCAALREAFGVD